MPMPQIDISPEAYVRIQAYAKTTGVPIERAASNAIEKWMDSRGDDVMKEWERLRSRLNAPPKPRPPLVHA
jgi:hypothetical protein